MDIPQYEAGRSTTLPGESVFWPVSWSAVWVGALAALAATLFFGLIGVAVGAHIVDHGEHIRNWRHVHFGGIAWAVCSAFFSFVIGGWVAARITGHPRSEPAMLHGAITWLLVIPILLVLGAMGAGAYLGPWYSGYTSAAVSATRTVPATEITDAYLIARNNALGALTALSLGLIGSVIGGWMASGEPMTFLHYRTRGTFGSTTGVTTGTTR